MDKEHISLKDYIKQGRTQSEVARALGITQGAVRQMINSDRDIRVIEDNNGIKAYEVRSVPAKTAA